MGAKLEMHGVTFKLWPGTKARLDELDLTLDALVAKVKGACDAVGIRSAYIRLVNVSPIQRRNSVTTGSWNSTVRYLNIRLGTSADPGFNELLGAIWHEIRHAWQQYHHILEPHGRRELPQLGGMYNSFWGHYFHVHEYDALLWECQVCKSAQGKLLIVNQKRQAAGLGVAPAGEVAWLAIRGTRYAA